MTTLVASPAIRLDALTGADEPRAGAKAVNCARLRRAGVPAPDGLAIPAGTPAAAIAALASHPWFDEQPRGQRYAVRSSGIGEDGDGQSFAGVHRTELDVRREDVGAAVAACLASAHDAQAVEYRRARGLASDDAAMGVLIQPLVRALVSGVAFTVNPVTGAADELVINASWGLGEALVSGQVDPDEIVVGKADGAVRWRRLGDKGRAGGETTPALNPGQLAELVSWLIEVERQFGTPQDVEWCHDGRAFWFVQSRPVTTAPAPADETEWTRANLAEVLPDITSPQALETFNALLNESERLYLGRMMAPDSELGPMVAEFQGRLHFNLAQLRRICVLGGVPPAAMLRSMGHAAAIHPGDEAAPRPSLAQLACLPAMLRIVWRHLRADAVMRAHERRTTEVLARMRMDDPAGLDDRALWGPIARWRVEAPDYMQTVLLLSNVLFHEQPVRKALEAAGTSYEAVVYPYLASGERSVSAQQAVDLVALAAIARDDTAATACLVEGTVTLATLRGRLAGSPFLAALERFLAHYGHRAHFEYDWALPRYHEDPATILNALRAHLVDGGPGGTAIAAAADPQDARAAADAAWAGFIARLSPWRRWTTARSVRRSMARIKQYYLWREHVRSDIARMIATVRARHLVLARRFADRGWLARDDDYFLLHLAEVGAIIDGTRAPETLRATAAARAAEQHRFRRVQMPHLMRASELPALVRRAHISGGLASGEALTGHPVSAGIVEGEVVVVRTPDDFARMKRGAILVAPATDPSWTPLFTLAAGVIVEVGGVLSHASTIAREYGLPALANVRHATRLLQTGERVRLDAVAGVIERLDAAPEGDRS